MEMTITTPSLLFPAISLLLLAYTNRFVVLTNVIRQLSGDDGEDRSIVKRQVASLRSRLQIIRAMQSFGVLAFLFCTLSMISLLVGWENAGVWLFGSSLLLLVTSLLCSLYEVHISTAAINIEIEKLDLDVD